jgi:hypothetical protein
VFADVDQLLSYFGLQVAEYLAPDLLVSGTQQLFDELAVPVEQVQHVAFGWHQ